MSTKVLRKLTVFLLLTHALVRPQGKQLWKWTVLETFERLVEDKHIKRFFFYLHFASFASYILIMKCLFVLLAIVAVALAQGELIKSGIHGGEIESKGFEMGKKRVEKKTRHWMVSGYTLLSLRT